MTLKFNRTPTEAYPEDMRTQLWPLCCGAKTLSGFKQAHKYTDAAAMAKAITEALAVTPDLQVFVGESINPQTCFVTINGQQSASPKITEALKLAGFLQFAKGTTRNHGQTFWVRDTAGAFELTPDLMKPAKKKGIKEVAQALAGVAL